MRYLVMVTDFHRSLGNGMQINGGARVVNVQRRVVVGSLRAKLEVAGNVIRCAMDRRSVAIISHPFNPWTALFAMLARRIELYDDGIAYYARTALPTGAVARIYKIATRRHFNWRGAGEVGNYYEMLEKSRAARMHAVYPELLGPFPFGIVPIDPTKAFPLQRAPGDTSGVFIYLDTAPNLSPSKREAASVVRILKRLASQSRTGKLYYRAHPTGSTPVISLLAACDWATPMAGPFESQLARMTVECVVSYYSSGAISVRSMHPNARIINLRSTNQSTPSIGLSQLFDRLKADEITY